MSRRSTTASAALLAALFLGAAGPATAQPAPTAAPVPPGPPPAPLAPSAQIPPLQAPPGQSQPPAALPPGQPLPAAPPPGPPLPAAPPPGPPFPSSGPPGPPLYPPPPGQSPPPSAPPPASPGWQTTPDPLTLPEPLEPAGPPDGITRHGLPITRRGHITIETSTLELTNQSYGYGSSAIFATGVALEASAHLTGGLYASVRYASAGFAVSGNLMGGADYIFKLSRGTWFTVGAALGVPLEQGGNALSLQLYGLTGAGWNLFEYMTNVVPLRLDGGFEMVRGGLSLRVDLQPVVLMPFDSLGADPQLLVQHAVEVQYGHTFGAGVRLQGVANTYSSDAYQAAVEPFVVMRRDLGFARLGLLKTLDEENPFYNEAWGMRFSAGVNID